MMPRCRQTPSDGVMLYVSKTVHVEVAGSVQAKDVVIA